MALIDRDALIAKIRDDGILGNGYSDSEREDDVIDMIESCQTVNAKPVVRGEWKDTECGTMCSHCHRVYDSDFEIRHSVCIKLAHCPSCGADMRGEADGNDK